MSKSHCLFLILISSLGLAQAHPVNVLPDNEKLCMQTMGKLLAQQQVVFSDSQADPDIRRAAERAIDITREVFSENESYCEAQQALQAYEPEQDEGFHFRQGEVNFFGRGTT